MSYILKWLSSLYEIVNLTKLSFERYLKGHADRKKREEGRQANVKLESLPARCRMRMYKMDMNYLYSFVIFSLFLLGASLLDTNKALVNL